MFFLLSSTSSFSSTHTSHHHHHNNPCRPHVETCNWVSKQMAFQALCMPGTNCKTHVERMGKSARYSKSSRFRPRAKRKLKILKEKDDEDDQGKNKYVVYKDKCVICMVIAAFMVIVVIHTKHEPENSQSLPQLVGRMNHIVDALDAQAGTELIAKKQPAKKKNITKERI